LGPEGMRHLISEYLPKHRVNLVQQVQVLCPATRGGVSTRQLNVLLQQVVAVDIQDTVESPVVDTMIAVVVAAAIVVDWDSDEDSLT